jgi:hypothetical protein
VYDLDQDGTFIDSGFISYEEIATSFSKMSREKRN